MNYSAFITSLRREEARIKVAEVTAGGSAKVGVPEEILVQVPAIATWILVFFNLPRCLMLTGFPGKCL
jgi:hypothetical protein